MQKVLIDASNDCEIRNISGPFKRTSNKHYSTIDEFIDDIKRANTVDEIREICSQVCRHYGFDFFSIFIRFARLNSTPICYMVREEENDWARHYSEKDYVYRDPGIRIASTKIVPFIWSTELFEKVRSVIHSYEIRTV